ncbi:MAG: class I adenylate-forming enzyme family protein [Hyphomicrobiaceae bacterium]
MRPYLTLHDPARAKSYHDAGLWGRDTFFALMARHARERPSDPALRDGSRQLTWGELHLHVDAMAADLVAAGLVPGDVVSLWMGNRLDAVVTFFACAREGFACNPSLHRTYTCAEICTLLTRLGTRALVTEPGWGSDGSKTDLKALLNDVSSLKKTYDVGSLPAPLQHPLAAPIWNNPDTVRYLAFTSGTTGAPKCVMHSDNSLLANPRDMVRDWNHGPSTRLLTLSPLSHHIAWVAVAQWLVAGCTLITDDPPAGTGRLDWIVETGATYCMGVPTHAMDMLAEQSKRGMARIGSVEVFYMAGSPIPPTVAEAFVLQGIKPQNVYGMTESSSHQYTHPTDDTATIIETCGRGGPAYEIKLFDPADQDREVPPGTVGQITGRGAALMLGYFGNQEATESSFNRSGWFLSGDLGVLDDKGNLRIEGRLKDLIIRGGHNIYPSHIEALALRNTAVARCAVFPVADERLGERVCIAIIGDVSSEALLAHLAAEGLSKYDMPEFFLKADAFPLTASGKILKRSLVDMVKRGELAPVPIRFTGKQEVA